MGKRPWQRLADHNDQRALESDLWVVVRTYKCYKSKASDVFWGPLVC